MPAPTAGSRVERTTQDDIITTAMSGLAMRMPRRTDFTQSMPEMPVRV